MATAVVTGSASGIGKAAREALEAQGDRVIGIDVHEDAEIVADLSTAEGRQHATDAAIEQSDGKIDYLVLAAGLSGVHGDARAVLQVNYFGTVELLDGLFDALKKGSSPCAVLVTSNSSQFLSEEHEPIVNALLEGDMARYDELMKSQSPLMTYAFTKNAIVRAMRRRAALWGGAGVRIVTIAPGKTLTPMVENLLKDPAMAPTVNALPIPLGRDGQPEEMGELVKFLLSKAASYVHASVLWVDGGTDAAIRPDRF